MTDKLKNFTMPDSGVTVVYRPVAPSLVTLDVRAAFPPPPVYKQWVDYGDGHGAWEENRSHPEYQQAVEAWETEVELLTMNAIIIRSLVLAVTDEVKAQVQDVRADMEAVGLELPKSDKLVWFRYIACASDRDWQSYLTNLSGQSEPNEETVKIYEDGFRGDVREQRLVGLPDA